MPKLKSAIATRSQRDKQRHYCSIEIMVCDLEKTLNAWSPKENRTVSEKGFPVGTSCFTISPQTQLKRENGLIKF